MNSNVAERSFLFTRDPRVGDEAANDYAIGNVVFHWKSRPRSFAVCPHSGELDGTPPSDALTTAPPDAGLRG